MATVQSASASTTPPLAARQAWQHCEYCMICGGYAHIKMFIDAICDPPSDSHPREVQLGNQCSFTRADEKFQHDVVLIGPFKISETARMLLPWPNMSREELAGHFGHAAPSSIRLLSGLFPADWDVHRRGFLFGDHPDPRLQSYTLKDGRLSKVPHILYIASSVFFYAHATCYNLLCDFAPCFRDRPALIWQLLIESRKTSTHAGMPGIDYLEMARTMRSPGPPLPLWYLGVWLYDDEVYNILSQRSLPCETGDLGFANCQTPRPIVVFQRARSIKGLIEEKVRASEAISEPSMTIWLVFFRRCRCRSFPGRTSARVTVQGLYKRGLGARRECGQRGPCDDAGQASRRFKKDHRRSFSTQCVGDACTRTDKMDPSMEKVTRPRLGSNQLNPDGIVRKIRRTSVLVE